MPWRWHLLASSCLVAAAGGFAWIGSGHGDASVNLGAGQGERSGPATRKAELEEAVASLRSEVAMLERQVQIERASYADLARQVKQLTLENAQLKEEVTLVQTISAPHARQDGIKISTARIEPNALPGEYSYRIVLLQTGSRARPFQGHYQLVVNVLENGRKRGMTLPGSGEGSDSPYRLDFRVHQRIDGTFRVDPAAAVRDVELRVFEGRQSQPKLMQTITLS